MKESKKKRPATRQKIRLAMGKRVTEAIIEDDLDGIQKTPEPDESLRIEPRIHQMSLSGRYWYRDFDSAFPTKLKVDSKYSWEKEKRGYYSKVIINVPGFTNFTVCVFLDPIPRSYRRPCWMEITPRRETSMKHYKELLKVINRRLPRLEPSKVEYATDQFCKGPKEVESLFDIEMRFLFRKSLQAKGTYLTGGQFKMGKGDRLGRVYKIKEGEDKLYERGPDDKKDGEGYPIGDCDKVRLEHTANKGELKRHGIKVLADFIKNPMFYKHNHGRYRFSHFEDPSGRNILPKPWEPYLSKDSKGNPGMFLKEHQAYRHHPDVKRTLARRTVNTADFKGLLDVMDVKWRQFDEDWKLL